MAIIYTLPIKSSPVAEDLVLISDSEDNNKTKNVKLSSIVSSGGTVTSLTTNGSSGASTLSGGVLNIPIYAGTGGGSGPYNLKVSADSGSYRPILLEDSSGSSGNSQIKLEQGSNVTLTSDTGNGIIKIDASDTTYSVFTGATSGNAGSTGLVPQPNAGDEAKFLRADSTWQTLSGGYVLPAAQLDTLGGLALKYAALGNAVTFESLGSTASRFYAVNLDSNNDAYVNVPWADNNTEYVAGVGLTLTTNSFAFTGGNIGAVNITTTGNIQAADITGTTKGTFGEVYGGSNADFEITSYGNLFLTVSDSVTTARSIEAQPVYGGTFVVRGDSDGSGFEGAITLNCSQNSHGVTIKSPPHSANATYTLVLPTSTGTSGQFLKTDGSGVLSWDTASGGIGGSGTSLTIPMFITTAGVTSIQDSVISQSVATGDPLLTINSSDLRIKEKISHTENPADTFFGFTADGKFEITTDNTEAFVCGAAGEVELKHTGVTVAKTIDHAFQLTGDDTQFPGRLRINSYTNDYYVGIVGPNNASASSYEITLPNKISTSTAYTSGGRILESDSTGALQWIDTPTGGSSGGGFPETVPANITASGGATLGAFHRVVTSSSAQDIVITLPALAGAQADKGKIIGIKWVGEEGGGVSNTVIIKTPATGVTIDNDTNSHTTGLALGAIYNYYELVTDGDDWWIK